MELNDETTRLIRAYEERCNTLTERCAAAEKEAGHQRNRADGFEGDIRFITKAYFEACRAKARISALEKEAEFQRTRANGLEGVEQLRAEAEVARHDAQRDRDQARAYSERLQDVLAKTQKDFADVAACLAEMSNGRVTNYDFTHRGKGEDHVQQLLAVIREGHEQDMAERRARLEQATEATPLLGVLARVHEVFDNLQPGCAGRLGGAWRLYEAGWRADQTVEEAHRLLGRRMGERMVHPDPIVCALIEATKSQCTGPDAVKALAPLALATCPAPDEALVANLERAMADRDKYREALLAAGMNADEPEPIKWAKEHAQEVSDNEAIVRMLGITAWEAGPAMEPDPVATLVELFQFSMPPEFTLRCEDEAEDGTKFAARWTWTNDGEASPGDFATPLLALEDAWIRYSALGEAKARKEAAHVVDTIERVAKEHGVEFDRTSDASVTRSVVALGEKLKGHATDSARSAVLEDALRTAGMPPHCSNPVRWADVHVDGWKTMRSALGRLVQVREVDGATIRNLADLEHVCDKYSEETRGPVLVCASHPELGEMVTLTIPQGYIRTPQGRLAATIDSLIGGSWDLQAMGGTRADAVKWWETLASRWATISAVLGIPASKDPPIAIEHFVSGYSDNIRKAIRERSAGVSLGQALAMMAVDLAKARGALRKLGMPADCKDPESWAWQAVRVRTVTSIAEMFPEAARIVVVDPHTRVFGGAQDDKRVRIVNSDIGHSEAQDRADVVVVVRSDGTLAKDGASDSTVTVRHLASAGSNMAYCGAPNDPHSVDSPSQMDCPACSAMLARDCSSVEGPVPAKAPGWTGVTWTSRKGKPKSLSLRLDAATLMVNRQAVCRIGVILPRTETRIAKLIRNKTMVTAHLSNGRQRRCWLTSLTTNGSGSWLLWDLELNEANMVAAARWAKICTVLRIPADEAPPTCIAGFVDTAGSGAFIAEKLATVILPDDTLGDVLERLYLWTLRPRSEDLRTADVDTHMSRSNTRNNANDLPAVEWINKAIRLADVYAGHPTTILCGDWRALVSHLLKAREALVGAKPPVRVSATSIVNHFPQAMRILIADPHGVVDGAAFRARVVDVTVPFSRHEERSDVVVEVRHDGGLDVRKNRYGQVGIHLPGWDKAKAKANDDTNAAVAARTGATAGRVPAKAPGWTGITWTSRKGKPKSMSLPFRRELRDGETSDVWRLVFTGRANPEAFRKLTKRLATYHLPGGITRHGLLQSWEVVVDDADPAWTLLLAPTPDVVPLPAR